MTSTDDDSIVYFDKITSIEFGLQKPPSNRKYWSVVKSKMDNPKNTKKKLQYIPKSKMLNRIDLQEKFQVAEIQKLQEDEEEEQVQEFTSLQFNPENCDLSTFLFNPQFKPKSKLEKHLDYLFSDDPMDPLYVYDPFPELKLDVNIVPLFTFIPDFKSTLLAPTMENINAIIDEYTSCGFCRWDMNKLFSN